jgi:hypothetical protein
MVMLEPVFSCSLAIVTATTDTACGGKNQFLVFAVFLLLEQASHLVAHKFSLFYSSGRIFLPFHASDF